MDTIKWETISYEDFKEIFNKSNKEDIITENNDYDTPFHIACMKTDNEKIIKQFINYFITSNLKEEIIVKNYNKLTPFHYACLHTNNEKIIKLFIEFFINNSLTEEIIVETYMGSNTPFHFACLNTNNKNIKYLLINYICTLKNKNYIIYKLLKNKKAKIPLSLKIEEILINIKENSIKGIE